LGAGIGELLTTHWNSFPTLSGGVRDNFDSRGQR